MQPMLNARLRPRISPTLPPVIISDAITSVYIVIAVWMPVTVVSRSLATVAIAVFMTVVSSAITNWPAASVSSTTPAAFATRPPVLIGSSRAADRGGLGHDRRRFRGRGDEVAPSAQQVVDRGGTHQRLGRDRQVGRVEHERPGLGPPHPAVERD